MSGVSDVGLSDDGGSAGGRLDGRVVAIAGACGGLGPSVAERLAAEGAWLALADRDAGDLAALEDRLSGQAERILTAEVDLLDANATSGWAGSITSEWGRIDGLAHLVGGWRGGDPIEEAPRQDYEWLHDLLVRTVHNTTRGFTKSLADSGRGRFVLVSSSQAQQPESGSAAYAATKASAEAWTLALADRFTGTGATANIVVVDAIVTPQMRVQDPDGDFDGMTPAADIADAIAYLCSDAAAEMNGQRLSLHG